MIHRKYAISGGNQKSNSTHTLEEIVNKFHKIKEEKFKPKDRSLYRTYNNDSRANPKTGPGSERLLVPPKSLKPLDVPHQPVRPLSAHYKGQGVLNSHGQRRMSLPSLFHPITPLPAKSESAENVEKLAHDVEEIVSFDQRRRHSIAHTIVEYSKHDLEYLSKLHENKLKELNQAKTEHNKSKTNEKYDKRVQKDQPLWLNGDDLHAFYNMWESKSISRRKKMPHIKKKLPLPVEDEVGDSDYERPRVFSF